MDIDLKDSKAGAEKQRNDLHAASADDINRKQQTVMIHNTVATIFIIVFFLSIIIFYYLTLYSETRENITKNCELNAMEAANEIEKYLSTGTNVILMTSYTIDDMMKNKVTNDQIQKYMESQNFAASNVVTDQVNGIYGYVRGEFLNGIGWQPYSDYDPVTRPWYTEALKDPNSVSIVNPYHDARTGAMMITMSKTLYDGKSVVALDVSIDKIEDITVDIAKRRNTDYEIVLDSSLRVIAHSDIDEVGKYYTEKTGSLGNAIVDAIGGTVPDNGNFMLTYNNQKYIVYTTKIDNDWSCISVTDITIVFNRLAMPLTVTIIVTLLVVAILLFIMIRSFRKDAQAEKMKQLAEKQTELAHVDPMTGLKNRRAYTEMIDRLSQEVPEGCKVVVFDLNGLKEANDTLGHEAGDELICAAAECLRTAFTGVDDIYRIGGDEFCLVTTMDESELAECLKKLEQTAASWSGKFLNGVSISYGIGTDREHAHIENIFREADKNMYKQKQDYYNMAQHDRRRRTT